MRIVNVSQMTLVDWKISLRTMNKDTAIWQCTIHTFLCPMMDRVFRDMGIDIILAKTVFIHGLHKQVLRLHQEKHQHDRNVLRVYSIVGKLLLCKSSVKWYVPRVNWLLSVILFSQAFVEMHHFISLSGELLLIDFIYIIFKMTIDPVICDRSSTLSASVADIGFLCHEKHEEAFTAHINTRIYAYI